MVVGGVIFLRELNCINNTINVIKNNCSIILNIIINIMQSNRYDHYNDVINIIKEYI